MMKTDDAEEEELHLVTGRRLPSLAFMARRL